MNIFLQIFYVYVEYKAQVLLVSCNIFHLLVSQHNLWLFHPIFSSFCRFPKTKPDTYIQLIHEESDSWKILYVRSELLMFYSTENNFMIYFTSGLYYYLLWLCIVNYVFPFISLFILVYVVSFVLWSNYVSDLVNVLSIKLCAFCKNINFKHVMCRYVCWDGIRIA